MNFEVQNALTALDGRTREFFIAEAPRRRGTPILGVLGASASRR